MQVFLLDEKKITKLSLPSDIDGVYSMTYKPENLPTTKTATIEAMGDAWVLKSNGEINAIQNGQTIDRIVLSEYGHYQVKIIGVEGYATIFCMPNKEENYYRVLTKTENITIGKTADTAIYYNHESIKNHHLTIYKEEGQWYVRAPEEDCIAYLNDIRITKKLLKTGDIIFIYGLRIIWLMNFMYIYYPSGKFKINTKLLPSFIDDPGDNSKFSPLTDEEENVKLYKPHEYFYHTPRLIEVLEQKTVKIDTPPPNQKIKQMPFILTLGASLTMVAGSFMMGWNVFLSLGNNRPFIHILPQIIMMIAMLIGGVLMPRLMQWYQKRQALKREQLRQDKYGEYIKKKLEEIDKIITDQSRILQERNPSLHQVNAIIQSNSRTKWSKKIKDIDFLEVRVGSGSHPALLNILAPEEQFSLDEDNLLNKVVEIGAKEYKLEGVPITFSFIQNRISAVVSADSFTQDYINGIILQLAAFHSAANLKLVFLINDPYIEKWRYAKFLPHTLSNDKTFRYFASSPSEYKAVCAQLEEEFNRRQAVATDDQNDVEKVEQSKEGYKNYNTYYMVITNDFLAIKNQPVIDKILNSHDNLGFSLFLLENALYKLPSQCDVFLQIMKPESFIFYKDVNNQTRFTPEYNEAISMRDVSNRLANIPLSTQGITASLPQHLTFLEMYNASRIEQLNISNRWKENDPTQSLGAQIGVTTSGDEFVLDLHERYHGPHGLIAGTTGSGKSEFIITYILSLALNYHPDEVQIVIIDYKGGGLAGAFENRSTGMKLPHLVGTITNLDISEMNRTLVSINSELKQRQARFNAAREMTGESSMDIYKYQQFYRDGLIKEPMSHLFIISDEFAELKSQQPDFMNELVSTARIGRSLGVHLILATQKPGGVVTEQIWSNSKFKVCLKVQSRGDSMEMLKKPDAASLKEPGRFYLQIGNDEFYDIGQSGWAGAKYKPSDRVIKKVDDSLSFINNIAHVYKSSNNAVKKETGPDLGDQLTNMVKHIIGVAEKENYVSKQLWQNAIPEEIFINDLKKKYKYEKEAFIINPPIGEYDNPSAQFQGLLTLDITGRGNAVIYGMPRSGKENLLSTIIYSTIIDHHPSEVNFYIIDMGAETLRIFEKMPHVGDVCYYNDGDKIYELLLLISKEITRRKELFADYNGNYTEYIKNSGKVEPSIVLVINNYEAFTETFAKFAEILNGFYRESNKCGIYFVVACTAINTIKHRVADFFPNKICLQLPNDIDYRTVINAPKSLLPKKIFGRGLVSLPSGQYEFQSAYIYVKEEINNVIKQAAVAFDKYNYKAKRIPVLPEIVTLNLMQPLMKELSAVPIGVNGATKEEYFYDFSKNNVNVITTNDMEPNMPFFYALIRLLKKDSNVNLRLIDVVGVLDKTKTDAMVHDNAYDQVLSSIMSEIGSSPTKENVYFIFGIGELKNKLSIAGQALYEKLFSEANQHQKTKFIVADNYNSFKKFQTEPWYNSIVESGSGIWIGPGVGNQFAIAFANMSMEEKNLDVPDISFVANKGSYSIVKKVVLTQEGDANAK